MRAWIPASPARMPSLEVTVRGLRVPRTQLTAAVLWVAAALPSAGVCDGGPALELAPPVVDQTALRTSVWLKNRGTKALAPADVIVRYTVVGVARGARPMLAEGTFEAAGVAIPPGVSVEIGHFVLPDRDRALSFEEVIVSLRAEPRRPRCFEIVEASFPHRWHETTLAVTSAQLGCLAASCSVTLDNQDADVGHGRSTVTLSFGSRTIGADLELPRPCGVVPGGSGVPPPVEALIVADLRAQSGAGSPAISIRDGKLQVRMELGSGSSDEIRVAPVHSGRLGPSARAAADVRPFIVEVELIPAVSADGRRLSYGRLPTVRVGRIVTVPAAGSSGALLPLEETVEACIREPLTRELRRVFDRSQVRAAVEEFLAAATADQPINFIRRVSGRSDTVFVTYV